MHIQNEYDSTVFSRMVGHQAALHSDRGPLVPFSFSGLQVIDHTETISRSHKVIEARTQKQGCFAS